MLLDEWGGGHRGVHDQNEGMEVSPTFQQLDEDNPEHRVGQDQGEKVEVSPTFQQLGDNPEQSEEVEDFLDYPILDDNDLSKIKAFEEVVEHADISLDEVESSLEANSQEENRPGRNKKERVSLGIRAVMAKDNDLSREKRARKHQINRQKNKRKVKQFKQVVRKKERKSDLEKEKAKCKGDINELKKQNKKMKKEIEKLKKKKRPKESQESKEKRIKSGCTRNSEGCNEKWAAFSSAAIGPAAVIIKQVGESFYFFSPIISRPILSLLAIGPFQKRNLRKTTSWRTKTF